MRDYKEQYDIAFPPYSCNQADRLKAFFSSAERWIKSEPMLDLLHLFDLEIDTNLPFKQYLDELNILIKAWDFRGMMKDKKQSEGIVERFELEDETFWMEYYPELFGFLRSNNELILDSANALGMENVGHPTSCPSYILTLGGARFTNLYRNQQAKKAIDAYGWRGVKVIGLGANRPIDKEAEENIIKTYAKDANTEFDAVCAGLENAFGLKSDFEERSSGGSDMHSRSVFREYREEYKDCKFFALAARPLDGRDRANTHDGYQFFIEEFKPQEGEKIVICTSSIYRYYQGISFMDLALKYGLEMDAFGTDSNIEVSSFSSNSGIKYLQEITATCNAISNLVKMA